MRVRAHRFTSVVEKEKNKRGLMLFQILSRANDISFFFHHAE